MFFHAPAETPDSPVWKARRYCSGNATCRRYLMKKKKKNTSVHDNEEKYLQRVEELCQYGFKGKHDNKYEPGARQNCRHWVSILQCEAQHGQSCKMCSSAFLMLFLTNKERNKQGALQAKSSCSF